MKDPRTKETIGTLLSTQRLAVLSTRKGDQPYASLVAFSHTPDLKRICFLTASGTRKYDNLLDCSRVALLVHSAQNRGEDFARAISVTALGRARPLATPGPLLDDFLKRHPELENFSRKPDTVMIGVSVETYLLVSRFETVEELRI